MVSIELTPLVLFVLAFGVGAIFYIIYTFVELLVAYYEYRVKHG
jgi:hypothetical protein